MSRIAAVVITILLSAPSVFSQTNISNLKSIRLEHPNVLNLLARVGYDRNLSKYLGLGFNAGVGPAFDTYRYLFSSDSTTYATNIRMQADICVFLNFYFVEIGNSAFFVSPRYGFSFSEDFNGPKNGSSGWSYDHGPQAFIGYEFRKVFLFRIGFGAGISVQRAFSNPLGLSILYPSVLLDAGIAL